MKSLRSDKGSGNPLRDTLWHTPDYRRNPDRVPFHNPVFGTGGRGLGIPAFITPPVELERTPDCSFLTSRHIAIIISPTRAVSLKRFPGEYQGVPRLVMVDVDSSVQEKIRYHAVLAGEGLIEPGQEYIMQKLRGTYHQPPHRRDAGAAGSKSTLH